MLAKGSVALYIRVSHRHEALFSLTGLTYLSARGLTSLQIENLDLELDGHQLMQLKEGKVASSLNSAELRREREAFPELQQAINRAWKLTVADWNITFPYLYDFAEAFSEDFVSLVKWLKNVHQQANKQRQSRRRKSSSAMMEGHNLLTDVLDRSNLNVTEDDFPTDGEVEAPLPPDIVIKVNKWLVTLEDDPFEVKLRYNYELMEDEYQESCKRTKAFNGRIHELQRSGAFLTAAKVTY